MPDVEPLRMRHGDVEGLLNSHVVRSLYHRVPLFLVKLYCELSNQRVEFRIIGHAQVKHVRRVRKDLQQVYRTRHRPVPVHDDGLMLLIEPDGIEGRIFIL